MLATFALTRGLAGDDGLHPCVARPLHYLLLDAALVALEASLLQTYAARPEPFHLSQLLMAIVTTLQYLYGVTVLGHHQSPDCNSTVFVALRGLPWPRMDSLTCGVISGCM